jgi:hypothetical protein
LLFRRQSVYSKRRRAILRLFACYHVVAATEFAVQAASLCYYLFVDAELLLLDSSSTTINYRYQKHSLSSFHCTSYQFHPAAKSDTALGNSRFRLKIRHQLDGQSRISQEFIFRDSCST